MPIIWIEFPTGTSPEVAKCKGDPKCIERLVRRVVKEASNGKASLKDLYFNAGTEHARAGVKDLDNYIELKAVCSVLGADSVTKCLTVAQAVEARALRDTLT